MMTGAEIETGAVGLLEEHTAQAGLLYGLHAAEYARYRRDRVPAGFFRWLRSLGSAEGGAHALDVGCGPGHLSRSLAKHGFTVTAVDPSAGMIAQARLLTDGRSTVEYVETPLDEAPVPVEGFSHIFVANCYHWLGTSARVSILHRLRAGGVVVVLYAVPRAGAVMEATSVVLEEMGLEWQLVASADRWMGRATLDLLTVGMRLTGYRHFDYKDRLSHRAWRGRLCTSSALVGQPREIVLAFDERLTAALDRAFPDGRLEVPMRLSALGVG